MDCAKQEFEPQESFRPYDSAIDENVCFHSYQVKV